MKISAIVLGKYSTFEVIFFARKMSIFALKRTFLGQNRPNIYMWMKKYTVNVYTL